MSEAPDSPARVRVTGPPRHHRRVTSGRGLGETPLGSLYVESLLRAQRAAALRTLATLVVVVGGLPLLFHLLPDLSDVHVLGMPLAWLVVGVATYPFLLLLGWRHLRRAERIERDFTELVGREVDPWT